MYFHFFGLTCTCFEKLRISDIRSVPTPLSMGTPTALQTIFLFLYLTVNYKGTTGTTFRPTTTPTTTIPNHGPNGECFYEGTWYADGKSVEIILFPPIFDRPL